MLDRQRQFADFPVVPGPAPGRGRGLVRRAARRGRRRSRAAGLGRRDVPRAAPRHPDHPGPHQVPAPPGRAGADHRGDAVEHGDAARRADGARSLEDAVAGRAAQRVPRHPARLEHPRGLRAHRERARRGDRRGERDHRRPARRHRRPPRQPQGDGHGVLVVNPDLSPRPLRLASPEPLPGGQAVDGGSVLAGDAPDPTAFRRRW